ncbi:unnamed protein product [Cuscuta campestris]|uniref:Uncharacterized protein n=1 Tax=Cuscuta campestris TaxID=132261 RepID=A0A484M3C0_9ASTE|nr:unnamed protein product [Cuscuta campestris]
MVMAPMLSPWHPMRSWLQAIVFALFALSGSGRGTRATLAPRTPITKHATTSQVKGKKIRRSKRAGKAPVVEEVIVEDVPEEGDSSEDTVLGFFAYTVAFLSRLYIVLGYLRCEGDTLIGSLPLEKRRKEHKRFVRRARM